MIDRCEMKTTYVMAQNAEFLCKNTLYFTINNQGECVMFYLQCRSAGSTTFLIDLIK